VVKKVAVCGVGLALLFSACSTATVRPAVPATPTPAFVSWSQAGAPDKRVCALPFTDRTGTEGLAAQVRESFSGHLSIKRFSDVELHQIDARLDTAAGGWRNHSPQQLGQTVGCDALIYGEVTRASRLYLGVYTQLTLEGAIRVVDAHSGRVLVEESYTTKFRAGGVPLSPLAVVPSAVLNLRDMTDTQMVRVIDDLGRHLAEKVPDLPAAPAIAQLPPPLPPPTTITPAAETPQVPASSGPEHYRLQVAAFSTHDEAQQAARLLRGKGYQPALDESAGTRRSWQRLIVGPFPSIHAAQQAGARIKKSLPFAPVVLHTTSR